MAIDPQCLQCFADQHEMLTRIDQAIRGNGKPGLNTRVDRCERQNATVSRWMWVIAVAAMGALFKSAF